MQQFVSGGLEATEKFAMESFPPSITEVCRSSGTAIRSQNPALAGDVVEVQQVAFVLDVLRIPTDPQDARVAVAEGNLSMIRARYSSRKEVFSKTPKTTLKNRSQTFRHNWP